MPALKELDDRILHLTRRIRFREILVELVAGERDLIHLRLFFLGPDGRHGLPCELALLRELLQALRL